MTIGAVEAQRRPQALALHLEPDFAKPVGRQFGLAALVMDLLLEGDERDLADHRVQHVLDLAGEHDLCAGAGRSRVRACSRKVSISPKTEAVSARVNGVSAIR